MLNKLKYEYDTLKREFRTKIADLDQVVVNFSLMNKKKIGILEKLYDKENTKEESAKKQSKKLDEEIEIKKQELKSTMYIKQTHNRIIDQTRNDIIALKKKIYVLEKSTKMFSGLIKREEYSTALIKAKTNKIFDQKVNTENKTESNKIQHEGDLKYYNVVVEKKQNFLRVK